MNRTGLHIANATPPSDRADPTTAPGGPHDSRDLWLHSGTLHACALDSTGAAYCWGYNVMGQLGDGSTTHSIVPVTVDTSGVLAGKTLTQPSTGSEGDHTCPADSAFTDNATGPP